MLFMLVDAPDPRYRGGHDPDEERERRWEPISRRLFVPAAGSMFCFALSPVGTGSFAGWALMASGVALCAQFVRVCLRDVPQRGNRTLPVDDNGE
jgi:hypothetical protein